MKFKLDENLPSDLGAVLRRAGHDVHSVLDENLRGAADSLVAKVCQDERRILITLDLDFAHIRNYPPQGQSPLPSVSGLWTTTGHESETGHKR